MLLLLVLLLLLFAMSVLDKRFWHDAGGCRGCVLDVVDGVARLQEQQQR
jgi:hypothetical protein